MRRVPEWFGKTDNAAIPPRVRLRLFEAADCRCNHCLRKLGPADKWDVDHIIALANGGEHREGNMQVLCAWCHKEKTREDVAEKAKTYAVRSKHVLPREPSRLRGAGFPSRQKQHTATRPIVRKTSGEIVPR